jgi:hypothetical protein
MEVDVTPVPGPEPRLHVRLRNTAKTVLETYEHSLPWRGVYSMVVIVVRADSVGSVLDRSLPVDDPGPGTVTVKPGEILEGDVAFAPRFPGFVQALAESDLLVFWSYQFQVAGQAPLPWTGGFVLFPSGRSGAA